MTNFKIIYNEIITNKLMTKEALDEFITKYENLPAYMTYMEWQRIGYQVKKGEKAVIKTKLWKQITRKIDKKKKKTKENTKEDFVLVKANLFSKEQVKKVA